MGPLEPPSKFLATDSWRVFRIVSEFVDGFETMAQLGPSVAIFGSSRLAPASKYYNLAIDISEALAKRGFSIITGGGPGVMEAANQGAQKVSGNSCGLGVDIPTEPSLNAYIDKKYTLRFRYFFVRKVMFIRYAQGYVFLPGGFGTMDELFEALTLIQTKRIQPFPIYLLGSEYWAGLIDWIKASVLKHGCIAESDLDLLHITDNTDAVVDGIEQHYQKHRAFSNF